MTRNQALKLAKELEDQADSMFPCQSNLPKHAVLMKRVEALRSYANHE